MPAPDHPPPNAKSALAALALAVFTTLAAATPQSDAVDPVTRLLVQKGLLHPEASIGTEAALTAAPAVATPPGFAQRVRDKASEMVLTAMNFLGAPYRRGGSSVMAGFDCSGFTRHIFEMSLGLVLPRRVDEQASAPGLVAIKRDELKPGDLVFFNTLKRTFSHVGIYVGEGKFIHAPRPGGEVRMEDMRFAYWTKRFTGARRAEPAAEAVATTAIADPAPAAD